MSEEMDGYIRPIGPGEDVREAPFADELFVLRTGGCSTGHLLSLDSEKSRVGNAGESIIEEGKGDRMVAVAFDMMNGIRQDIEAATPTYYFGSERLPLLGPFVSLECDPVRCTHCRNVRWKG